MRTRLVRTAGTCFAIVFAAVGLLFLLLPAGVVSFFDRISAPWGFPPAPVEEPGLFTLLAVAYMAVVTALAWGMARRPDQPAYPRLLVLAKIASSLLSFGLFFFKTGTFIVLANGIVDGLIGGSVLWLTKPQERKRDAAI